VDIKLDQTNGANSKPVLNCPIADMSPHLKREELAKEMLIDMVDEEEVPK